MSNHIEDRIEILVLSSKSGKEHAASSGNPAVSPIHAGQHVRIDGKDEVFVVLRIDRTRHLADLLRLGAVHKVEAGVPLTLLRVTQEPEPIKDFPVSA